MPLSYNLNAINLGFKPRQHGHVVYLSAHFKPKHGDPIPIVYKENKSSNPDLSRFEVAFGELARLFLAPNLTPPQRLVKNNQGEVVGLACEHISYTIARREMLPNVFYHIKPRHRNDSVFIGRDVNDTEHIPYYFLDQFPPGFFAFLKNAAERHDITLDIDSLAQLLAGSYALEEDDLHKANLGFYVVRKDNKPHVVFFKIDHDYMLADSVMSHCHTRIINWFHGRGAFEVTKRDLQQFPRLTDSKNYYWPTVKHTILGVGNKAYISDDEVDAFAALGRSKEFCRMKWLAFYKHVLIPTECIQQALIKHLDPNVANDRAQITMITQSVVARQAKLRAVLFTIPDFREVVASLNDQDRLAMVESIAGNDGLIAKQIMTSMLHYQKLCQPDGGFVAGDTPLHAAIRLQDYRYYDTWQSYGHFANQKNKEGKTALDVAVSMAKTQQPTTDIRCDALCTMKHMLQEGTKKTADYQQYIQERPGHLISDYLFHSGYPSKARQANHIGELKLLLRDLSEDHRYSLKMQKNLTLICVRQFVKQHKTNPSLASMLNELKADLNGTSSKPPAPELQYIRQLRSQLWIVRMIRGLLGGTATQVSLNRYIDKQLKQLTPTEPSCWSFFAHKKTSFIDPDPRHCDPEQSEGEAIQRIFA